MAHHVAAPLPIPPPTPPKGQAEKIVEAEPLPDWQDAFFPWMISLTFHVAIGLVVAFTVFLAYRTAKGKEADVIIIPNSFEDPAFSEHPGGIPHPGENGDPNKDAMQALRDRLKNDGWNQAGQSAPNPLSAMGGADEAPWIAAGKGGSVGTGKSGESGSEGSAAAYGVPGGGSGAGLRSSFYGTGGNATRIVYILDHSGSMLDNFDFLRLEAIKSVDRLVPLQSFAVVLVSDHVSMAGPAQLTVALPEAKKQFGDALKKERAEGQNDNLLGPFEQAFNRAFAMRPQLIYFLTDGRFGDGLIEKVNVLNKDKKVHINTIAFVTEEPGYKEQLEQLAKDNGGSYKFIPERDLGR